ncbi:MAG TPA: Rrf2 family transcriptional regulator [Planctomycetaceae bacterium]|jgi:Rrf2 family protein|nr:Rrf2 family transcriptional regulator [Planctomycetaceae bacterium]
MKLSAKAEYACLAVLELARRHDHPEPARLTEIAGPNGIPERFLVQILLQLKGAGYISSLRGASGGYRLAVEPREITLWDVVQTVEGPPVASVAEQQCSHSVGWHVLHDVWIESNRLEQEHLQQINFEQLVESTKEQNTNMYYI